MISAAVHRARRNPSSAAEGKRSQQPPQASAAGASTRAKPATGGAEEKGGGSRLRPRERSQPGPTPQGRPQAGRDDRSAAEPASGRARGAPASHALHPGAPKRSKANQSAAPGGHSAERASPRADGAQRAGAEPARAHNPRAAKPGGTPGARARRGPKRPEGENAGPGPRQRLAGEPPPTGRAQRSGAAARERAKSGRDRRRDERPARRRAQPLMLGAQPLYGGEHLTTAQGGAFWPRDPVLALPLTHRTSTAGSHRGPPRGRGRAAGGSR